MSICFCAYDEDLHVIVDLAKAAYLGPDSLASLLHAAIAMSNNHRQLLLAEMPAHLQRVLKAARLMHCFRHRSHRRRRGVPGR